MHSQFSAEVPDGNQLPPSHLGYSQLTFTLESQSGAILRFALQGRIGALEEDIAESAVAYASLWSAGAGVRTGRAQSG